MLSGQVAVVFRCAVASQVYVYKSAVFLGFRVVNRMRGDGSVYAGPGGLQYGWVEKACAMLL